MASSVRGFNVTLNPGLGKLAEVVNAYVAANSAKNFVEAHGVEVQEDVLGPIKLAFVDLLALLQGEKDWAQQEELVHSEISKYFTKTKDIYYTAIGILDGRFEEQAEEYSRVIEEERHAGGHAGTLPNVEKIKFDVTEMIKGIGGLDDAINSEAISPVQWEEHFKPYRKVIQYLEEVPRDLKRDILVVNGEVANRKRQSKILGLTYGQFWFGFFSLVTAVVALLDANNIVDLADFLAYAQGITDPSSSPK